MHRARGKFEKGRTIAYSFVTSTENTFSAQKPPHAPSSVLAATSQSLSGFLAPCTTFPVFALHIMETCSTHSLKLHGSDLQAGTGTRAKTHFHYAWLSTPPPRL